MRFRVRCFDVSEVEWDRQRGRSIHFVGPVALSRRRSIRLFVVALLGSVSVSVLVPQSSFAQVVIDPAKTQVYPNWLTGPVWTTDDLIIGIEAEGKLTVGSGGTLQSRDIMFATAERGSGELFVDGGSVNARSVSLGHVAGGAGALVVSNGGQLTITDSNFFVGRGGSGTAVFESGASVKTLRAHIVESSGSSGTVTVRNATWDSYSAGNAGQSTIDVGNESGGAGRLIVEAGGKVNTGSVFIQGGSDASVVSGAGAELNAGTVSGSVQLGIARSKQGALEITNGGTATAGNAAVGGAARGDLLVSGTGSKLSTFVDTQKVASGLFQVGVLDNGVGVAKITDGATLNVAGDIIVGRMSGSTGTLIFGGDPGSAAVAGGNLNVVGTTTIGLDQGSKGTLVIGGQAGSPAARVGTLSFQKAIRFANGDGTLVFNHNNLELAFGASLASSGTGTHRIDHLAGVTRMTANSSAFTGTTNLSGGNIILGGPSAALGGLVIVGDSALISGTGTLGTATTGGVSVQSGGIISPGETGLAVLNVRGTYSQASGSVYRVELDPQSNNSDRIAIDGTANIASGAILSVSKNPAGNYSPYADYTVLTTTQGRTGQYTVQGDLAVTPYLNLVDVYDQYNVYLRAIRTIDPRTEAITPNEKSTSGGLTPAVEVPILNAKNGNEVRSALNNLSGVNHASLRGGLVQDSHIPRELTVNRLRDSFCTFNRRSFTDTDANRGRDQACSPRRDQYTFWGSAYGSFGHVDSDGNAAKFGMNSTGVITGVDTRVADTWRIGLLAGYSRGRFSTSDYASTANADSYKFGAYAGTQSGPLGLRFGTIYSWYDNDSSRTVRIPNLTELASSRYSAGTTQVFGELGYTFDLKQAQIEPYLNASYVNLNSASFAERGGITALTGAASSSDHVFTTLGFRSVYDLAMFAPGASFHANLGWRHAFGDVPTVQMALAGGSRFGIAGVPIETDVAVLQTGFDYALTPAATITLSYGGSFGRATLDQSVRARVNASF